MAYVVGENCHMILTHASVNGGSPYGFILRGENKDYGPDVSIQREVSSDGTVAVRVFFDVLLADDLVNPDGSKHSDAKAAMYAMLTGYLGKLDDMTMETSIGVIADLKGTGHVATESHYAKVSIVACQLNNAGVYFPPVSAADYNNSIWDGSLTWNSSYWR